MGPKKVHSAHLYMHKGPLQLSRSKELRLIQGCMNELRCSQQIGTAVHQQNFVHWGKFLLVS